MSELDAFGANLRRIRVQRGITLDQIAAATNVSVDLWAGMERNDFSRWPTGLYARAYVRAYAAQIGADPEATVDQFCRCFPQGDRRAERVVREHAAIMGHDLRWEDDLLSRVGEDRRSGAEPRSQADPLALAFTQTGRIVAAIADAVAIVVVAVVASRVAPVSLAVLLAVCAMAYHGISLIALGRTPAVWVVDTYLAHRHPASVGAGTARSSRLLRGSDKANVHSQV